MEWIYKIVRKVGGEPLALGLMTFILACVFVYNVPKYIVTTNTFATEKDTIYVSMQKGDSWQEIKLMEMELRSLTQRKWEIEDRIDKNIATSRDIRRLQDTNTQIKNLQFEMDRKRKYIQEN